MTFPAGAIEAEKRNNLHVCPVSRCCLVSDAPTNAAFMVFVEINHTEYDMTNLAHTGVKATIPVSMGVSPTVLPETGEDIARISLVTDC